MQAKHPLYGLRFTNTTDLHLMQGPITVFDGGVYAGDAQIEDLPPKSERLISYGMDLDTEVAPETKDQPEELLSVRLVKGTMLTVRKYTRSQEYTVKNSGKKAKNVLIEYPIDAAWTLVSPEKPTREDPRPVPLRRRGQAGRAGQADGRRGADRASADRADEHQRQHDPDST